MRLCVIGNSHVGMLRAAAGEFGRDGPEITFFAKAGGGLDKATVAGSVISAEDRGLRRAQARFGMPAQIDVATFDATILVAGTVSIYSALRILQTHRVSGWPSCIADTNAATAMDRTSGNTLMSEPAFVAALADEARTGVSFRFARAFRRASDVPIFVVPPPFPSERVFETGRPEDFGFHRARRLGDGSAIASSLGRAIDTAFAAIGDTEVLHQPEDTIAHGFTTSRAYTRDAVRVDGRTPQHRADLLHVGPAYGKRVLDRVFADLKAGCVI